MEERDEPYKQLFKNVKIIRVSHIMVLYQMIQAREALKNHIFLHILLFGQKHLVWHPIKRCQLKIFVYIQI